MTQEFPPQYEPHAVEDKWMAYWHENKVFGVTDAELKNPGKKPFCIVIPPPNVTGSLHMGHALNSTLQDVLVRYHRMCGDNALWVVGTDHAGIATQNVVERQLAAEGKKRDDLGREDFIKRVWEWKKESGGTIISQLKRLGASCDFDNERFTMDEGLSRAVRKVFISLYEEGLIYRGKRLINWCPRCHTALSDLEVEHEQKKGHLWHIRYPIAGTNEFVIVATTRPETLFGDVAVAVHPEDERYLGLAGKSLKLPLTDLTIPLIKDDQVDRAFGTGAVKITPAHDFNDYATGSRHGLTLRNIFTHSATLNENVPPAYQGMDRFKARDKVVAELEALGLLEKTDDHSLSVGHCYRCKSVVEPYLSDQWFVKAAPLAEKALTAVRKGHTRFVPQHWEKTYYQWMENIQDWCISRQIWWGHQIPAWYCAANASAPCPPIVCESKPDKCPHCGSAELTQDADVLDTWFSSGLWPFSTLGWPDATERLKYFYPTSVLVTAFDIIFFWVARMMMLGCHFMGKVLPEEQAVPFKDVYIHALVRDPLGQKMSKSKGNVVDPLIMMHKYGTDAFRFTLAAFAAQGRDIKLDEQRIEGYRAFCNKIWNAARFGQMMAKPFLNGARPVTDVQMPINGWILAELARLSHGLPPQIENYEFNLAAQNLYTFFWNVFCDWYIEFIKPVFRDGTTKDKEETAGTFFHVLNTALALLHPFMPFITEEIFRQINGDEKSCLTRAAFPKNLGYAENPDFATSASNMTELLALISTIRSLRQDTGLKANAPLKVLVQASGTVRDFISSQKNYLTSLAKVEKLTWLEKDVTESCAYGKASQIRVYLSCAANGIDKDAVRANLMKKNDRAQKNATIVSAKLANAEFITNAPVELVNEQKATLAQAEAEKEAIATALGYLELS